MGTEWLMLVNNGYPPVIKWSAGNSPALMQWLFFTFLNLRLPQPLCFPQNTEPWKFQEMIQQTSSRLTMADF